MDTQDFQTDVEKRLCYVYMLFYAFIHMHIHSICMSKAIKHAHFQFFHFALSQ